ncbi:MAG: 3-dehydroquinate synthase [Aminipila sp.]
MKRICIDVSKKYDVVVSRGFLKETGKYVLENISPCKVCLVSDDIVSDIYGSIVKESLVSKGFEVFSFNFTHGENSKTLTTVQDILNLMAINNFTRSDIIVALGGGIVGDISGFAASIFLRGINFIQIPTTFLAAIDSSVGGKTGVNLESGKNLCGCFWQPSMVLCDCSTFSTLPYDVFLDGVAEAIKYGCIFDKNLFDLFAQYDKTTIDTLISSETLLDVVSTCVSLKRHVVKADERDTGIRQLLNFGHTLGHAIEKCSNYSISHGHAVAIGMVIISQASFSFGLSEQNCSTAIANVLQGLGFQLDCPFTASELTNVALKDKKRLGETLTVVIPSHIGDCKLQQISVDKIEALIQAGLNSL